MQDAGITLNMDKCEFDKDSLIFLAILLIKNGISPDPAKTSPIAKMEKPQ